MKKRKHTLVTQCLKSGNDILIVWKSEEEESDDFVKKVEKLRTDPRIKSAESLEGGRYKFILEKESND